MINIYKPKLTNLQQGILRLLSIEAGFPLNQRGIANHILDSEGKKTSPAAVMKALPDLEKKGLIALKQDKESRRWSVELNRDNPKVIQIKRTDNLKQIYESGLADFLEKEFAGATIILFGSYSKGEDTIYSSDIDMAIMGRKRKEVKLTEFDKKLERTIRLNFYNSFKEIDKDLKNSILNGIILSGSVNL